VLSIAHLSDEERMFFVTLFLNEVIAWMRSLEGTGSLRAILYMDEIFGYFPPVKAPPSKAPMLTLLKQARAYGLGVLLASVDLHYVRVGYDVDHWTKLHWLTPLDDAKPDWSAGASLAEVTTREEPENDAAFAPLPDAAGVDKNYTRWQKSFLTYLYRALCSRASWGVART